MHNKLLIIISILLFSASAVMFANDISEEVQAEQQIEQEKSVDFRSDYNEYSAAEKSFAEKYEVDPKNTSDVWLRFKSLINTGIKMAVSGGVMTFGVAPTFLVIGSVLFFAVKSYIVGITMFVLSILSEIAGFVVMGLSSMPFCKAGTLSYKYKKLYNIKLKNAAEECGIISMHDPENREAGMAVALGIR